MRITMQSKFVGCVPRLNHKTAVCLTKIETTRKIRFARPRSRSKVTFMSTAAVLQTSISDLQLHRKGKVRDVYEVDDNHLLIVATDRISAFDCVLPTAIERKGEVLTSLSEFWFEKLGDIVPNHLITTRIEEMPETVRGHADQLRGRSMLVRRTQVFPVECVVRGYLVGSGWKDYLRTGEVCGHRLPENLLESAELPVPIFTPATKAEEGHDENISEQRMRELLGD